MRIMYDAKDPSILPADAEIVAWYPETDTAYTMSHLNALIVRVDAAGDKAVNSHGLAFLPDVSRKVSILEWVTQWYTHHRGGMAAVNGWIARPFVMVGGNAARAVRVACAPYDIDVWGVDYGPNELPPAGCFARKFTPMGPDGEPYGVSRVYNDEWGKMADPPAPAQLEVMKSNRPLRGLLVRVVDGCLQQEEVSSYDWGETWQS